MSFKADVVIIHGTYGSPEENWFPWLANSIKQYGHNAIVPKLPTPEDQSLMNWSNSFKQQVGELTENMVLVGHSLGPGFILNLLERSKFKVLGTFLVSAFIGELGNDDFDSLNKSFVCRDFNWSTIAKNCGETHIYNSDNDPYVPLSKGEEIANNIHADLTIIKKGGHINAKAGFRKFPLLYNDIIKLLKKYEAGS
jgi:predicted alpha/beta hydrolase family esterase